MPITVYSFKGETITVENKALEVSDTDSDEFFIQPFVYYSSDSSFFHESNSLIDDLDLH